MAVELIDDVVYAEGWDHCLIGHGLTFTSKGIQQVAIYDRDLMASHLCKEFINACIESGDHDLDECDHWGEADEFISFNIEGAYLQEGMPVYASIHQEYAPYAGTD